MIITRKWLEQFLNLNDISNDQISVALNSLGFEVEQTTDFNNLNSELLVGYVEESVKVPDTHLKSNKIKINKNKTLDIICGAENIDKDQYVIVAPVGSTISNGLTLTEREIRGNLSQGMVCALNEIGIPTSSLTEFESKNIYNINLDNIDLNSRSTQSAKQLINLDDYIWEVDLTLNRSDCLASFQLLKEIANYFNLEINNLNNNFNNFVKNDSKLTIKVNEDIKDLVKTIAFSEYQLNDLVKLNSKDDIWLKLNNTKTSDSIIENLALKTAIQTAQALIVIDKDKLLKNNNLELKEITREDNSKVLALTVKNELVNIIGLEVEEKFRVDNNTKNIIVLMLNIDTVTMRNQQKILNTSTIALQRYIKPINPNLFELANLTFANELEKYNLIQKATQVVEVKKTFANNTRFNVKLQKINDLLGVNLTVEKIKSLFRTLDFNVIVEDDNLTFDIDVNRVDIYSVNDICEEIARLYGYDNIVEQPINFKTIQKAKNIDLKLENKLINYLIGLGFNNTKTYSLENFDSTSHWNLFDIKDLITLEKPLSKLRDTYRTNLSKSLIDVAIYNSVNNNKQLKLFEIADIYAFNNFKQRNLVFLTTSNIYQDNLSDNQINADFYYNKSILGAIFKLYNLDLNKLDYQVNNDVIDEIHPFINATIKYDDQLLGFIYRLNPGWEKSKKIDKTIVVEINLDKLNQVSNKQIQIKELSKFQSSKRDFSIELNNDIKYSDVIKKILDGANYITNVEVIDQYIDEKLEQSNKKSLTIQITFNSLDHQLTEQEINDQSQVIINNLNNLNITIR
ncbi:phenylalanine--tRNA ligase subunit beta [Mycoplasma yeatsii]|uniref:phenylalanine--tRNA ligase subunit beta n=1 Tax=Mycoplasma yeatsii TaxID=51365 RepID=UPI0005B24415|nr:phenylalanine--tRNA ligase subunit beta [Mycoplasma yeatsii]AJM71703.1 phenylalanyl-tRNA synthetase subunit beta [Mycoplasma yeatsii GM274B]